MEITGCVKDTFYEDRYKQLKNVLFSGDEKHSGGIGLADMQLEWLFDVAIECSKKSMYPDFLSLTGEGYIASIYKKYGKVISLMGKENKKNYTTLLPINKNFVNL